MNATLLFDIRNAIGSSFRNGFIKLLEYQSAIKLKRKPKSEESIAERTKLKRRKLHEFAKKEKTIDLNFFDCYFRYSSPNDTYKELNKTEAEANKVRVGFIRDDMAN